MKTFSDVRKYLNSIPNIHCGGCGIAALAMYRWLEVNSAIKNIEFYFFHNRHWEYNENRKYLKNKNNGNVHAPSHVGLKYRRRIIDSEGFILRGEFLFKLKLDIVTLIAAINNVDDWNSYFNRRAYVSKIAKNLKIDLSDVRV